MQRNPEIAVCGRIDRRLMLQGIASAVPLLATSPREADAAMVKKWLPLAEDVRAQMAWAWRNYEEYCFGQDQIKPVSGSAEGFFFPNGPPLGLSIVEALELCMSWA